MSTPAPTTPPAPATPEQGQAPAEPQMFDAEYVANLRKEAAGYRTQAKANADAAKRLAEIEEAQKTEAQKASEALAAAQREAEAAKLDALRYRVGITKGLPPEVVARLQGTTEEELSADADALAALIKPSAPPVAGRPTAPQSGSVPPVDGPPATDGNTWLRQAAKQPGR